MSSVTGVSLNAIFPSGLADRQQMGVNQQPRPESPLFVPVGEAQKTMRGENRREINPEERQGAGQSIERRAGSGSPNAVSAFSSEREANTGRPEAPSSGPGASTVSDQALQEQRELARRDREVRAHEQAHKAIAGQYAGQVRYEYTQGPDGRRYAVAGSVEVDLRPAEDPERTIEKMEQVLRAALAPSEPSAADRQITAQANQLILEARAEALREQQQGDEESAAALSGLDGSDESMADDEAVALRTSEAAREAAAERSEEAERERASRQDEDETQDSARVDEQRDNMNTDAQQRLLAVQEAIAELLRNQGGSLDDVTLGRTINFEV